MLGWKLDIISVLVLRFSVWATEATELASQLDIVQKYKISVFSDNLTIMDTFLKMYFWHLWPQWPLKNLWPHNKIEGLQPIHIYELHEYTM